MNNKIIGRIKKLEKRATPDEGRTYAITRDSEGRIRAIWDSEDRTYTIWDSEGRICVTWDSEGRICTIWDSESRIYAIRDSEGLFWMDGKAYTENEFLALDRIKVIAETVGFEGKAKSDQKIIGFVARLVFWISAIYLVIYSCVLSWMSHDYLMAVLKIIFFPITWIISPWFDGQWKILLLSWGAYLVSTIIGGLPPVDR